MGDLDMFFVVDNNYHPKENKLKAG